MLILDRQALVEYAKLREQAGSVNIPEVRKRADSFKDAHFHTLQQVYFANKFAEGYSRQTITAGAEIKKGLMFMEYTILKTQSTSAAIGGVPLS